MFVGTGTPRKPKQRAEARRLRKAEGLSLKRIAAKLDVSPSSVLYWTRDIELSPEQHRRNLVERGPLDPEVIRQRTEGLRRAGRARRAKYQQEGRRKARMREPLHFAGCMLYWAEGSKEKNAVKFCNSDPHMLALFREFLVHSLEIPAHKINLNLHVYLGNGLSISEIEEHWLRALRLPQSSIRKHQINPLPTSSSGRKKRRLPYGVVTLTVHSTQLIQHIFGAIQEYGGFEAPRWLDGPPRRKAGG